MKTKNIIFTLIAFIGISLAFASCVKKDAFDAPPSNCDELRITPTHTIAEFKALLGSADTLKITDSIVIRGTVTSSDQWGNFYKEIVIQDSTGAIPILATAYNMNLKFPIGQIVNINCKGMYLGKKYDAIKLGGTSLDGSNYIFTYMSEEIFNNGFIKTCDNSVLEPKVITLDEFLQITNVANTDKHYILVKIENVQFDVADTAGIWADPSGASYSEHNLIDANGNEIKVSTSSFCSFAEEPLPNGNGTIIGLIGVFYEEPQLKIINTDYVDMNGERF